MRTIYASQIKTPDGTILRSQHRHDYKTYTDANGETYMIDGGYDYFRSSVNRVPATNITVYTDDPHEIKREIPVWGTYGKNGDDSYHVISVAEMTDAHMSALLDLGYVRPAIVDTILEEIKYREHLYS
jgi:hypothetical protein